MPAYADLQTAEFSAEKFGYTAPNISGKWAPVILMMLPTGVLQPRL
jgi:hypothetical protein